MTDAMFTLDPRPLLGRVVRAVGTTIEATMGEARIGEICTLRNPRTGETLRAEVVGISDGHVLLTPLGNLSGLSTRTEVFSSGEYLNVEVGPGLLGRVLDGFGIPLDGDDWPRSAGDAKYPLDGSASPVLDRALVHEPIALGIRAIDGLLTCAIGQRLGIYGEPGAGKSSLLAQIMHGAAVDIVVVALIGERGREVTEFIHRHLADRRDRTIVVVATADRPAAERAKAALVATSIAEYFRDRAQRVLLIVDSLTRFARAIREIGLAAGEAPSRRGFTPSVFAALPALLERAGPGRQGSITAFYTVLVEGDGTLDPIAEETRAVLDGHIVLSTELVQSEHFPAIDVLRSRSRVAGSLCAPSHVAAANGVRTLIARYAEVELIHSVGEYRSGSDPLTDRAIERRDEINRFLRQAPDEVADWKTTLQDLARLAS